MQKSSLKISLKLGMGVLGLIALWPGHAYSKDGVVALRNADGRIVFTNVEETAPAPAPVAASSPIPGIPADIRALVDTISNRHGVDPDLVAAMMKTESSYDRWAVSPKGALGLMQLIPETGKRFGVRDFFDPQQNIEGGVKYMRFLLDKFNGDIDLSLAAYNAGENLVARLGRIPYIEETQNYVKKIRGMYTKGSALASVQAVAAEPTTSGIFRTVDERGIVRFSNIGP
jgi:soluble lytic murein transglycosylase-like protein